MEARWWWWRWLQHVAETSGGDQRLLGEKRGRQQLQTFIVRLFGEDRFRHRLAALVFAFRAKKRFRENRLQAVFGVLREERFPERLEASDALLRAKRRP